jgi:predicted metalloprotease with PDZ domain
MRLQSKIIGIAAFWLVGLQAFAASIPAPKNTAYPGTITLQVDASDLDRRIIRVRQTIPVKSGPLTLLYPKWLPGNHAPRGPIEALAGPLIQGGGKKIEWQRDPVDMYALHVRVPAGVSSLDLEFQYATPQSEAQGRVTVTQEIVGVQWEKALLYPAGHYSSRITFAPSLTLPEGWKFATALEADQQQGSTVRFKSTSLETLVDSPLFAGKHFTRVELDPGAAAPVWLNVVGDSAEEVVIKPEQLDVHRRLVKEAVTLFGSRHYDRYEFLLAVSDNFSGIGLEHHRSSENGVNRGYFKDWDAQEVERDLLAHEMTHSWNGKFRRPADLWTPSYNVPMQNSLLWVYEGMTQYWGQVLAARSGLWSEEYTRGSFASIAANLDQRRQGREWRDLQDTTNAPIVTARRPLSWVSWQRAEDYYVEGLLIWLDTDTKLRELTSDKRSLDDLSRAFFGINDGSWVPSTYTFDDVVKALNAVAPFDWAKFLRERLDGHGPGAPLQGLERGGWKLVYTAEPSEFTKKIQAANKIADFAYSVGFVVDKDNKLTDVVWDSPAFKAGLATQTKLIAVNGREYSNDLLKQAIRNAGEGKAPIELLVKNQDRYWTAKVDYSGGLRYPRLERIAGQPDRLAAILKARN